MNAPNDGYAVQISIEGDIGSCPREKFASRFPFPIDHPAPSTMSDTEKSPDTALTATPPRVPDEGATSGSGSPEIYSRSHLLRKIDYQLLPILTLLYLMSFLDRTSIGNAKIAGMDTELGLAPGEYNIALSLMFVSYVSFEIPSNIILKRLKPSIWLPSICLGWGIVTMCTGFVQSFPSLVVVRLLLGFLEAGLFPGVVFLLTVWYPRHAVVFRFTLFFSAATLSGAFGGLLARGLITLDGTGDLSGWRWIFIIEGLITIAVALSAYILVPDSPLTSRFLSRSEATSLQSLLDADSHHERQEFNWTDVRKAFKEWKVYTAAIICIGVALPTFSFALFLPSIITGLGFAATDAQLMTVPPYVAAFIFTVGTGYFSDRHKSRGVPLFIFTLIGMVGYILLLSTPADLQGVKYFATFLVAVGVFVASGLNIPWLGNNLRGQMFRATGSAVQVAVGQLGGIAGAYIYRQPNAPRYFLGHGLALGFLGMAAVVTVVQWYLLKRANLRLDKEKAEGKEDDGFRYTL
ncbi:MFS general substrate transporter [Kalaharituber pfeilii]|nr:MFS general substrate transporter [Kalaharituber pfeilii]